MILQDSVIIIGGGPAGLASAKKALQMGYRVVMLEKLNSVRRIQTKGNPFRRFAGHGSGLGGTTNGGWGAQMALMDKEMLHLWCERMGVAETYISEFQAASFELSEWLDCTELLENFDFQAIATNLINLRRSNQFSVILKHNDLLRYFQDVINSNNFSIVDFEVKKLEWTNDNFSLVDINDKVITCLNSKLIIASGCIGSTELISASFLGEKIDNSQLRSIRDHPNAILFEFKLPVAKALLLSSRLKNRKKSKFVIKDKANDSGSFRYSAFEVVPIRCQRVLWDSNTQVEHEHNRLCGFLNKLDALVAIFTANKLSIRNRYLVWATLEVLDSTESSSPFEASGNWKLFSVGTDTLEAFQRISEALQKTIVHFGGFITNQADLYAACDKNPSSFESGHPSGTMPFGASSKRAFLNSYGISHFNSRLMVISTAGFPRDGWQNPTFTLMTLAIVGVKRLLQR